MIRKIFLLFLVFFLKSPLCPFSIEIYPEKKEVFLGERIRIELKLVSRETRIELKGVEALSPDVHLFRKSIHGDRIILEAGFYNLGDVSVPLRLFVKEGERTREVAPPPFTIKVKESFQGEQDIKPIKDIFSAPLPFYVYLLPLLVLAAFFYYRARQDIKRKEISKKKGPEEWAKEELLRLKGRDLPGKGKYKEYYDGLSDIVRGYLWKKHGIRALEMTLEELTLELKDRFNAALFARIRDILNQCDWIKFAPEGRNPENIEGIWSDIDRLIGHEF